MSCFWDGIFAALTAKDYKFINESQPNSIHELINLLKTRAEIPTNVQWNDVQLTKKELEECVEAIAAYDKKNVSTGYWCSTCDPFLLLISHVFHVNIIHDYCSHKIIYTVVDSRKTICFTSDRGHFQRK